jgi:DNA-binding SARP family transcriptional activator/predicted ATPase
VSRLSLYLLGPPRIERDGEPIKVDTRKAIALLAYIAITGESHRRDALVNLLWPEYDQTRGRAALRRTLSALKKALSGDWLDVDRESIGLNSSADVWLDVGQFRSHLTQCLTHGHPASEVCPACLTSLTDAVELYRGDFLSGFTLKDSFNFDDWQFFQADGLRRELAGALERLVLCHSAQGEFESAIKYARHWLALDRLSESAHCQLMCLYAWSGQRSAALRQYQECERILQSALGVSPQESTAALYRAIQEGRAPAPPVDRHFQRLGEQEERKTLLPSEVSPVVPDEEKRIVTVVCADVSGSFQEIEDVSSEDEVALIRRFLGVVEDGLAMYGGQVDRVLGGRVLGVFGTTRTRESDPELAIRAAIEVRKQARELGLNVTAGINTGEVCFSRAGAEEHREFTLMGTFVDLAARLAGKTRAGQILVGESTYRLTWRAFEFAPLSLDIKGMEGPVTAYQVERLLPQPKKARGIEGLRADLIGRDEEFAKLKKALKVLNGRGQMVTLVGEAGVGKSRLVAELKEVALTPGDGKPTPLWLEGRCLEVGTAASYAPFIDIFRGYFTWGAQEDDRSRREHILSSLQRMMERGDLAKERFEAAYPFLGRLLSVRLEDEWEERLAGNSPEQVRRRTFVAVHDFFVALSRQQPVVLVFEDLHWADDLSLDLISLLMEGLRLGPLLLLCVYRPEWEHKCWHLATIASQKCRERYTELYLRELTHQQSQRLVESLLTIETLPASVRDLILDRSQGNPFFIEEVVRSLIDRGIVYRDGDCWCAREEEMDSAIIPDSVQSIILSRLDHLDADLKHVLQVAAVIGRIFRRRVLEHAAQQKAGLESALWELEDRALVYQERTVPEVEYSFKHVLTQEAVYRNILRRHRRGYHQRVAGAIEVLYPDNLEEYYEQLAYHYEEGGHVEKAVEYLLKAGEKAKRHSANEAAIAHLTRGLALLEASPEMPGHVERELNLQIALGVPLVLARGHGAPEVERTYARAQELSQQIGDLPQRFQVLLGLRRFYIHRGDLQAARELGEQLLTLALGMQDRAHLSRAHMMHGEISYHLGKFAQTREHCERGIDLYDPQQCHSHVFLYGNDTGIGCRIFEALTLWQLGYPDQALKRMHEMLTLAQSLAHPFTLVFALYHTGMLHLLRREARAVREQAQAVVQISEERGFALYLAWGTILQGWALAEQDEIEDGITHMRQGLAAWRTTVAELLLPKHLSFLAKAYGRAGRADEGLVLLAEGLGLVDKNGERCWAAELHRLKGQLLLEQEKGEVETCYHNAEACFQHAIEVARRQRARSWELRAATSLGRLWQEHGKKDQARELLQETFGWFTEGFDTVDLKEARALLDALA